MSVARLATFDNPPHLREPSRVERWIVDARF
jgi:hypothetical protein